MCRTGWGASLIGDPSDLEDWLLSLKPPFDPWVEQTTRGFALRSVSFEALTDATEVRDKAKPLINLLNGALALSRNTGAFQFASIAEFMADESEHHHTFAEGHCFSARVRMRVEAVAFGMDGKPLPDPPPQPSSVQSWIKTSDSDKFLSDALFYFSRNDDWFDLFDCLECLFLKYGNEKKFLDLGWENASKIKLLRRAANNERHARLKNKTIPFPMSRHEARSLLSVLLRRALEDSL